MTVWDDVVGQEQAVGTLSRAAMGHDAMTNAWLLTGPPGSGRSTAARAFAAALQCPQGGCGACHSCTTVLAGTHPDVRVVSTETLSIRIAEVRDLVQIAQRAPAVGAWRVIIMEDADRMSAGTFNVLLKSIEEPPDRTVWVLCAPSPQDLAPTIRSRCRLVTLRIPPADAVAELLVRRDRVDPDRARVAARAAQSHIGIARRLATQDRAAQRRRDVTAMVLELDRAGQAVVAAGRLHEGALAEAKESGEAADDRERSQLLRTLGIDDGRIPPQARSALKQLEDEQKKRQTRTVRDVLDRNLLDIHSVFRDVLTVQLASGADLVNEELAAPIGQAAQRGSAERTLAALEAVHTARARINHNGAPLLALEALLTTVAGGPGGR